MKRECTFVFIGRDLDHEALEAGFMNCKAENLRFNKGDIIYANVGEFTKGKILNAGMKEIRTVLKFKMMKRKMFGYRLTTTSIFEIKFNNNF